MSHVKKDYYCPVCKVKHAITFPADFAKGHDHYPFSHVFLHKLENSDKIEEIGIDILTTLYIDANLAIRGVEAKKMVVSDIISKDDSKIIIDELMGEIERLHNEIAVLQLENKALKEKLGST